MRVTDINPESGCFSVPYITLPDNSTDGNTSHPPLELLLSVTSLFLSCSLSNFPSNLDFQIFFDLLGKQLNSESWEVENYINKKGEECNARYQCTQCDTDSGNAQVMYE